MENKIIAIGSDHGGFELKQEILKYLTEKNIEYKDFGCYDETSCDTRSMVKQLRKQWLRENTKKEF